MPASFWAGLDPQVAAVMAQARARLAAAGVVLRRGRHRRPRRAQREGLVPGRAARADRRHPGLPRRHRRDRHRRARDRRRDRQPRRQGRVRRDPGRRRSAPAIARRDPRPPAADAAPLRRLLRRQPARGDDVPDHGRAGGGDRPGRRLGQVHAQRRRAGRHLRAPSSATPIRAATPAFPAWRCRPE